MMDKNRADAIRAAREKREGCEECREEIDFLRAKIAEMQSLHPNMPPLREIIQGSEIERIEERARLERTRKAK